MRYTEGWLSHSKIFQQAGGLYHIPSAGNLTFLWVPWGGGVANRFSLGGGGEFLCPPVNMFGNSRIHRSLHQSEVLHEKILFSGGGGGGGGYSGWSDPKFLTLPREVPILLGGGGGGIFWAGQI